MRIVVTDGDQRSALAVVRSLSAAGHEISVGAGALPCLAGNSASVMRAFRYADPGQNREGFLGDVFRECVAFGAALIVPLTDASVFPLAEAEGRLPQGTGIFSPSIDKLRLAADKLAVLRMAQSLGVPVPPSREIPMSDAVPPDLEYPLVVKPRRSRVMENGRLVATGVGYADDADELKTLLSNLPGGAFPALLQKRIQKEGVGYFALAKDGEILAEFYHRRLRELPPSGGVSVLREAIAPDEQMKCAGRALLREMRWTGPAMVEFKRDENGVPHLMEINGRFWGSLQLAVDAGMDFPALLVRAFQGDSFTPPDYTIGTKTRYGLGDLESLAVVLLRGKRALPPNASGRLSYLIRFLREGGRWEIYRKNDPWPFFFDVRRFIKKAFQLIRKKFFPQETRGIVHCHTSFSYDGKLDPDRLALHLERRGLSFAGITEHEISMDAQKAHLLAAECEKTDGFTLIPGIEFATTRGTHILGIGVREFFDEHDPVGIVRGIRRRGGLAVLAHPDNGDFERDPEFLKALDGVEVWNSVHDGPFVPSLKNLDALREIRNVNPDILAFGGLDFHAAGHYRGARLSVRAEGKSEPQILDALRAGRFRTEGILLSVRADADIGVVKYNFVRFMRKLIEFARPFIRRLRRTRGKIAGVVPAQTQSSINVLHTIETGNPGGAENMMLSLVDNLPEPEFQPHALLLKEGWLFDRLRERSVPTEIATMKTLGDLRFVARMAKVCRRSKSRLIQSHEMYMNVHGALASRISGAKHVAVLHGNLSYLRPFHRRAAYRIALFLGTKLVTVSDAMRIELSDILGIRPTRIRVIRNGVPIPPLPDQYEKANARRKLGLTDEPTIAMIGSLYPVKGHDVLLAALPKLLETFPRLKVLFIGRGRMETEAHLRRESLPFASAVRFVGFREDVPALLPAVDVLALPSFYEGLSLTLCEAMAAGIPAVATDVGGNPEVVTNGKEGFLVTPGDAVSLAERLSDLLSDPELRRRMGDAARAKIIDRFSLQRMVRDYRNLYLELLGM